MENKFELMPLEKVSQDLEKIRNFQAKVKASLIEKHDFGTIPGTDKPTLLKPGAEKIAKLLSLSDDYEIVEEVKDWEKGFLSVTVKCFLKIIGDGALVSTGMGHCNSMESKYRWRWVWPDDVPAGMDKEKLVRKDFKSRRTGRSFHKYRLENEDIYSQFNTILKMAKKRSLVDAALSAGRLSDVFTQDIEDIKENGVEAESGNDEQKPNVSGSKNVLDLVQPMKTTIAEMTIKNAKEWIKESGIQSSEVSPLMEFLAEQVGQIPLETFEEKLVEMRK